MAAPTDRSLSSLIAANDLDEILREIDAICARRDWDALRDLRDRCDRALDRGFQLWPASHHAAYRLALEAPGEWAATVLEDGAARFAPGPLPEVAAQWHDWADLEPWVPHGPAAALALHERVVRGEDLRGAPLPGPDPLELPLELQVWEPVYPVAEYRSDGARFPSPPVPEFRSQPVAMPSRPFDDPDACAALLALVRGWTDGSAATARAVAVDGDAAGAVANLDPGVSRMARITGAEALAWMGWAAACGGAHGRRRGAATGRMDAWLAVAAISGLDGWPVDPDELGAALGLLDWWLWEPSTPVSGWSLHLAVDDGETGEAWALAAHDPADAPDRLAGPAAPEAPEPSGR